MFKLEQAISDWRRQMAVTGIASAEVLDELEAHLRDELQQQIAAGANERVAFERAVARIGKASVLKAEFAKLNTGCPRFLKICYFVFPALMLLINGWTLLVYELSAWERIIGFAGVFLICLYLVRLPYLLESLAAGAFRRLAGLLKLTSIVIWLWPIWALLEAEKVVHSGMGIVPNMMLWCLYAAFAMTPIAFALSRQPHRPGGSGGPLPPFQPIPQPIPPSPPGTPEFGSSLRLSKPVDPIVNHALDAARAEAQRLGHDFIGTEHVLLGLLQFVKGSFAESLRRMSVDIEMVRAELERLIAWTPTDATMATLPLTPRVRKAFKLAEREAKALDARCITAEHIFLGLLLEGTGIAGQALRNLGLRIERTRKEIALNH